MSDAVADIVVAVPETVAPLIGAVIETVGGVVSGADTVTVIDLLVVPPVPVHDNVYVLVEVSAPVDCKPESVLLPVQAPEAVQVVALVELHVKFDEPPEATEAGEAVKVIVGADVVTMTVTDLVDVPPAPVQDKV